MKSPLQSLVDAGTKVWLDSVDPEEIACNRSWGATGATSNPIIIADLIKTGRFDDLLTRLIREGLDDETLAWRLTDHLVRHAQEVFLPAWESGSFPPDYGDLSEERRLAYVAITRACGG